MLRFYRPPKLLRSLFPSVIWDGKPECVYLTFDDGPDPVRTLQILSILNEYQAPATFFTLGVKANKYLHVLERIVSGGCEIGIHSFYHRYLIFDSRKRFQEELQETAKLIRSVTSHQPSFFRPPYGYFSPWMLNRIEKMNMKTVMWSFLTYDFSFQQPDELISFTTQNIRPGDVLVFHDGHRNSEITVSALPGILEKVRGKYQFGKLTDLS